MGNREGQASRYVLSMGNREGQALALHVKHATLFREKCQHQIR